MHNVFEKFFSEWQAGGQRAITPANLQTPGERGKQVFAVRIRLKNPDPRVKAGMYATVARIGGWEP